MVVLRKGDWILKKSKERLGGLELLPLCQIYSQISKCKCYNILLLKNIKFKKRYEYCQDVHVCQEEHRAG